MAPTCVAIRDAESGAEARVLAGFGFNCFSFRVPHGDADIELLWSEEGFEQGTKRASGSGIPILFPFPGRIQGVEFEWDGRRFKLQDGDGRGNAIHGFVHQRPWRVIEQSASRVVGQFQASQDDPELLDRWPADFLITVRYEVAGQSLKSRLVVENPGDTPLPCGLGTHPYFRVPIGPGTADNCVVRFPVTQQWELDGMITTGQRVPLTEGENYLEGVKFADMTLDNVFSGLESREGACLASIDDPHDDPHGGPRMEMEFSDLFRECVVYNPPHREAVCIEPYTCAPDPFRLHKQGVDAGLRILRPGESLSVDIEIRLATR